MVRNIFDSHAHYDDRAFDEDRETLLRELPERGVYRVVNCGTDVRTSRVSLELAEKYDYIYAACGIHPEEAEKALPGDLDEIEKMLSHPKCVAVGEIGLDYHWDIPKEIQFEYFERQLDLAKAHDLKIYIILKRKIFN